MIKDKECEAITEDEEFAECVVLEMFSRFLNNLCDGTAPLPKDRTLEAVVKAYGKQMENFIRIAFTSFYAGFSKGMEFNDDLDQM